MFQPILIYLSVGKKKDGPGVILIWDTIWHNQKMSLCPWKIEISLGIRPVWSESSLCAQWVSKDPSCLHADREDCDETGHFVDFFHVSAQMVPV